MTEPAQHKSRMPAATDVLGAAGLGLVSWGAHLAWHPAGFIVPGLGMLALAILGARRG